MTSYSRLQINILAKVIDTTCIFMDAEAVAGGGSSKRVEGNGNLKNKKIVTNYVCFCSSTMLTTKINNRNYRKSFGISRVPK